jgi:hypothetical protein
MTMIDKSTVYLVLRDYARHLYLVSAETLEGARVPDDQRDAVERALADDATGFIRCNGFGALGFFECNGARPAHAFIQCNAAPADLLWTAFPTVPAGLTLVGLLQRPLKPA